MSGAKSALILGATGAAGRHLLQELLASSAFNRIGEYGRRITPEESILLGKDKLIQKKIDFENLEDASLKEGNWDVIFITLGTSRRATPNPTTFQKIDREYVVNAARLAKQESIPQRIVYISSINANPESNILYSRSKGLTELDLAGLGYNDVITFRAGTITERGDGKLLEGIVS
ncbi:hypothetical protein NLI96_g2843 [Meripilus lineatus]|uniref:NAD-dependent epimerase/dehydratase domain-containing protein n=1 Tax=Meripilus lineatus TaxID=2056292 RepID=A0AAD5YJM0_9APHY|nr:hypothetical protein NLI96_g2843 [Physisporinus lineatus]